jgi:hypothetical protein
MGWDEEFADEDCVRDFRWSKQTCAAMMRKRGVFVRAYGWSVRWLDLGKEYCPGLGYDDCYEAEDLHGFLLVRDDSGDYVCLPVTDDEARCSSYDSEEKYPKEGPVWMRNFLLPDIDVGDLVSHRHIIGRGVDYKIDEKGHGGVGQLLPCAIRTEAIRRAIQNSQASLISKVEVVAFHKIETVKLPEFQSAQQLRDYLFECGTRRTNKVIDPIGPPTEHDSLAYRWWWHFNGQAWLGLPGAIPGSYREDIAARTAEEEK